MLSEIELIRKALSDPAFEDVSPLRLGEIEHFSVFEVRLRGSRYRGIPRTWTFAVLSGLPPDGDSGSIPQEVLSSAGLLLMRARARYQDPLVFVSPHPQIVLRDLLRFSHGVFIIDARDLLAAPVLGPLHRSPFILSLRMGISLGESSPLPYAPYRPNQPAVGWRFFGRKRELERLTDSPESFFVVGPRRSGKTSLLHEAGRILKERGEDVYDVPCQHLRSAGELVSELARAVSPRDMSSALRRSKAVDEGLLHTVLKTISRKHGRVTIILDELGNLMNSRLNMEEDWHFIGVFRAFAHSGGIRLLMSGWQEILLRQTEFEGPFVNFATTLSIRGLSDAEISEFLEPLSAWTSIQDRSGLLRLVTSRVGRHPFLLQYFGQAMFESVSRQPGSVDDMAQEILSSPLVPVFEAAVDEMLYRSASSMVHRYLFLRVCREAEVAGVSLEQAEISEPWIDAALREIGYPSTLAARVSILSTLELQGYTEPVTFSRMRHRVAAPILYYCFKEMEKTDLDGIIELFADEVRREVGQRPETQPRRKNAD